MLSSGKSFEIPFNLIKKDRPIETAKFILKEVVEAKRGGKYSVWAKNILKKASRTIRRMARYHNVDRVMRLRKHKEIIIGIRSLSIRRLSKNRRHEKTKNKEKFGIKVPNNVREALIFDRENQNNLWADAILKEMTALDTAGCFEYFPPHHRFDKDYQYTPLRIIFDVKKEDLRRKARLVAGGHVIDSTMYESYSSVVQTRTVRML